MKKRNYIIIIVCLVILLYILYLVNGIQKTENFRLGKAGSGSQIKGNGQVETQIDSEKCPVDCTFSQSAPVCENGKAKYTVTGIKPALNGGKACYGNGIELKNVGDQYVSTTPCWDCEGSWVDDGNCSKSCSPDIDNYQKYGKGKITQKYVVSKDEANGGTCPNRGQSQVVECNNGPCYKIGSPMSKEAMDAAGLSLVSPGICETAQYGGVYTFGVVGNGGCNTHVNFSDGNRRNSTDAGYNMLYVNKKGNMQWVKNSDYKSRGRNDNENLVSSGDKSARSGGGHDKYGDMRNRNYVCRTGTEGNYDYGYLFGDVCNTSKGAEVADFEYLAFDYY